MRGWFHGYRDALVKCRLTPGGTSSSCGTAGSQRFICFSTNYPDPDSAVRRPVLGIGKRREGYFAVAQAAWLEAKHRKSIGGPEEKRLSPYATGKRAVCRLPQRSPRQTLQRSEFVIFVSRDVANSSPTPKSTRTRSQMISGLPVIQERRPEVSG
jgi:hypothetical protein